MPFQNAEESWMHEPAYSRFWEHYNAMKMWYYNHKYAMWRAVTNNMYTPYMQYYPTLYSCPCVPCNQCAHNFCNKESYSGSSSHHKHTTKQERKKKRKHRMKQRNKKTSIQNSEVPLYGLTDEEEPISVDNDEGDEEEFEMQITEEMIAFFEHSEKHRRELKAQRDAENAENPDSYTLDYSTVENAFTGSLQLSCLPPREQPGVRRTAEMKLLYGKNAAMIHGMETAMQLTFDRNCDLLQPKLWPNIPLKL